MQCEICGKSFSTGKKVELDGTLMFACEDCAGFGKAKEELMKRYKHHEGTLNWTDIDFWSDELSLDIPALKEQIRHLIEVHPHVEDFLRRLKKHKKKVVLATNAHFKVLDLKMKKTNLGKYFDCL